MPRQLLAGTGSTTPTQHSSGTKDSHKEIVAGNDIDLKRFGCVLSSVVLFSACIGAFCVCRFFGFVYVFDRF